MDRNVIMFYYSTGKVNVRFQLSAWFWPVSRVSTVMVQVRRLVVLLISLYKGAVRGYNYCRVTPFHTLCGYSGHIPHIPHVIFIPNSYFLELLDKNLKTESEILLRSRKVSQSWQITWLMFYISYIICIRYLQ